jgi:C4-dicarboxylate transporter DctM subunit
MESLDLLPFVALLLLLAARVPIGFALLLAGVLTLAISGQTNFTGAVRIIVDAPHHYTLLAIPFFIFTAELLVSGGLVRLLYQGGQVWLGNAPGGLGSATVAGTVIFAGISGSSAADVAAFSRIGVEGMTSEGFSRGFSGSLVASAGTLAIMIPPSIAMIIYGSLTDTSIGALMFAGVVPGLSLGLLHILYVAYVAKRRGITAMTRVVPWATRWSYVWRLIPILGLMGVILGGFYTGTLTATEVSTMSAVYTFIVGFIVYKSLKWRDLRTVMVRTASTTASIFIIIMGGTLFAKALTTAGFADRLAHLIQSANLSPWQFLMGVSVALYFLGMFLEGVSLNVMTTPLLAPIAVSLGVDPVHYGVFLIFNIEVALISPPVGLHLFIASAAAELPLDELYRSIWPFIIMLLAALVILIFLPAYALWLPQWVYGG